MLLDGFAEKLALAGAGSPSAAAIHCPPAHQRR